MQELLVGDHAPGRGMIFCRHTFHSRIGGIPHIRHRPYGATPNQVRGRFGGPAAPHGGAFTSPEIIHRAGIRPGTGRNIIRED